MHIDNTFVQNLTQVPFRASPEQKATLKTELTTSPLGQALSALAHGTEAGPTGMRSLIDNTLRAQGHEDLLTDEALDAFFALRKTFVLARAWMLRLGLPTPQQQVMFDVAGF